MRAVLNFNKDGIRKLKLEVEVGEGQTAGLAYSWQAELAKSSTFKELSVLYLFIQTFGIEFGLFVMFN